MRLSSIAMCLVACGGNAGQVCPTEKHLADPDGHGDRCIDDLSTCDAPADCPASGACCTSACVEPDGSALYQCQESCRQPECDEASCPQGMRCQGGLDACTAHCVPDDVECPEGWIPADPTGTGQYDCIRADSECLAPADCPPDPAGCCAARCVDSGDARFTCDISCDDGGAGEDADWAGCWSDHDCDQQNGSGGWTCVPGRCSEQNTCEPPPPCLADDDCTWAADTSQCCACGQPVPRSVVGTGCWVEQGWSGLDLPAPDPAPPSDECAPECDVCPAIACAEPVAIECREGACVGVYF